LHRFYTPIEATDVLLLFALQGLIFFAQIMTLIRILKSFYNSIMIRRKKETKKKKRQIKQKKETNALR